MIKLLLTTLLIVFSSVTIVAKDVDTNKTKPTKETNATTKAEQQLQKQIEREKKFAKEKTFYKGPDYDLSYAEIDPKSLDNIKAIEPDLEFDMDDVYD